MIYIYNIMKEKLQFISRAILAGICIALGGYVNMSVGGIGGAVLFAFGLCCVLIYGLKLFTGKAGAIWDNLDVLKPQKGSQITFLNRSRYLGYLVLVLLFNIIGCGLIGGIAQVTDLWNADFATRLTGLVNKRIEMGLLNNFVLAIGCGIIMRLCVKGYAKGEGFAKFVPTFFGVPLFILCGFPHCVADAFYYLAQPWDVLATNWQMILPVYGMTILGNFVGCNILSIFNYQTN